MKVSLLLPSTLPALDQKFSVLLVVGVLLDLLDGMFSVNVGFGFDFDFDFALSAFIIFISEDPYKSSSSSLDRLLFCLLFCLLPFLLPFLLLC